MNKKRTCYQVDFAVQEDHSVKIIENEKIDKYLYLTRELKNSVEHEGDSDTDCSRCPWNGLQILRKETGGLETKGRIKIIQTTALLELPRILRRALES